MRKSTLNGLAIVGAVLVACIGCDQGTKHIAQATLIEGDVWSFLGDTVRLQLALNEGAFLGLGASLPELWRQLIFSGAVALLMLAVLAHAVLGRHSSRWTVIGLALVLAGGVGNLADRLLHDGRVVDFMNLGIGPLRTGIFNVADVAIVAGALLLGAQDLRARRTPPSS